MRKICYFLLITALIITSCKSGNQNGSENRISSKTATASVPYKIPVPVIPLSQEQQTWLGKANRHDKSGWIYLHIEGSPKERGFQHGYLLANEIKESIRVLGAVWHYQSAMDWEWLVQKAGEMFTPKVDVENISEIDGIVEGMKAAGVNTTRDELVAYNGYMELMDYWWPSVKDTISPNSPDPEGKVQFVHRHGINDSRWQDRFRRTIRWTIFTARSAILSSI